MRIAVSGTHCTGKSTLVADFLATHRGYEHEPEPYEWLEDVEPLGTSADDFYRQLEVSVERLSTHPRGARVIAERCPLDFLAYLLALDVSIDSVIELAARGMRHVDVLLVVPLNEDIFVPESEDRELREAMNERLLELVANDEYGLLTNVRVVDSLDGL